MPKHFSAAVLLAALAAGAVGQAHACGPSFPNNLLDAGDSAVLQPPVADFKLELGRMKLVAAAAAVPLRAGQSFSEQSGEMELADLATALKLAAVPDDQAERIISAHRAERAKLNQYFAATDHWLKDRPWVYDEKGAHQAAPANPPPVFPAVTVTPGLPAEFAGYFAGAIAWHKGDGPAAHAAWEQLLKRPAAERKFKSTWAAYMRGMACLGGRNGITNAEAEPALGCFRQVADLAKNGFVDSAGLAVASIGREAQIELRRNDYGRALGLYLEQFAAGDDSAVVSLRRTAAAALDENGAPPAQLKSIAENSRVRRVIMAYLVSRNPYNDRSEMAGNPDAKQFFDRTDKWLAAVESAGVRDVESAQELALAAYQAGDMDSAQRWIDRAEGSPVAQWLRAKLFLRAGKIEPAAALLAKVSREFPRELPGTNGSAEFAQSLFVDTDPVWGSRLAAGCESSGELGVLHLARREYTEALDALLRAGGYRMDAAYVAERVLTTDELKQYVDRNWPVLSGGENDLEIQRGGFSSGFNPREEIRWLLARRLARETGGDVALNYFPTNYATAYGQLLFHLRAGRDANLPVEMRAKNLFAAAVMTRTNGMEWFGTELDPDWEIYAGDYDFGFTWQNRATNTLQARVNLAGADEIRRASSRHPEPDRRFHYRWQAAALAWDAAQLMPDNADETARVLCTAGTWLKICDPQGADKFYQALVRRCRKTAIGAQADRMRWFPVLDENGNPKPWPPPAKPH